MSYFLLLIFLFSLGTSYVALRKCKDKSTILTKPYKLCEPFGSFVWADHLIFGPFWALVSLACFLLQDLTLFALVFSAFWLVRSGGETMYWFFQQFHPRVGNEPENFWINRHAPGEAVWFLHQIFWQCVTVISLLLTIYLSFAWLSSLG